MTRKFYAKIPTSEVLETLSTNLSNGLSNQSVSVLRKAHGVNKLEEEVKVSEM